MTINQQFVLLIPLAYLIGSIPFGLLVGKLKGIDPRTAGSGNIGATNVGRLLGTRYFWIVFCLDVLKGLLPTLAAASLAHRLGLEHRPHLVITLWLAVAAAAILGHMYSIFLKFKGGKGVATSTGVILGIYPYYTLPGLVCILIFIITLRIWRYISLASIVGAASFPIIYLLFTLLMHWPFFNTLPLLFVSVVMAGLIVYKHRTNITRLRNGTESHIRSAHTDV